ncbi:MAG: hypothetical protein FJ098_09370, partial [Deltaproteobacteria bacterium]|nr:hypothetical protein [Deltaproteobacteria bacterium]
CDGKDWFDGFSCDGTGTCDLSVVDLGCCTHADCAATEYCAADHACTPLPPCAKPEPGALDYLWQGPTEDQFNDCGMGVGSGWDGCNGTCRKTMSNTGWCSGTSSACGTASAGLAAGKVCRAGGEVPPGTDGILCDLAITCAAGTCGANVYSRGCSAAGVEGDCVDTGAQYKETWHPAAGWVIAEDTYKIGASCEVDEDLFCDETDHCGAGTDDRFAGFTCNAAGDCLQDKTDIGCCANSDCTANNTYCWLMDGLNPVYTCSAIPGVCGKQDSPEGHGYIPQAVSEDLWSQCGNDSGWNGCTGPCVKTKTATGNCSGTSFACGTDSALVAAGKVCLDGAEAAPAASRFCTQTLTCVSGACSADRFYLGCAGTSTSCIEAGKVQDAVDWFAAEGAIIDEDLYKSGASCLTAVDFCATGAHCGDGLGAVDDSNTWYSGYACDGAGTCDWDLGDAGCCDHSYCGGGEFCAADHACRTLSLCGQRDPGGVGEIPLPAGTADAACPDSGWDGCNGPCLKTKSNSGLCSGGFSCGTAEGPVATVGRVCVDLGVEAQELAPSQATRCDVLIACVNDTCAADRFWRGCGTGGACTDTGRVDALLPWNAGGGTVIQGDATHTAAEPAMLSCVTDTDYCLSEGNGLLTDPHCSGNDWYQGFICDGAGGCLADQGDLGCCRHDDCVVGAEYCDSDKTCKPLSTCGTPNVTTPDGDGFFLGQVPLPAGTDSDDCDDSGWDLCADTCTRMKSNSGLCSGAFSCQVNVATSTVSVAGGVCVAGKPGQNGQEAPSAANRCDVAIDCPGSGAGVASCAAQKWFRGCATVQDAIPGLDCVDTAHQDAGLFLAPDGEVIVEAGSKPGQTCTTSAAATDYCDTTAHCVDEIRMGGHTCNGAGACTVSHHDVGCCWNIYCDPVSAGTYCKTDVGAGQYTCVDLPLCAQRHGTALFGYENQPEGLDLWNDCTASVGFDDCVGPCVKKKTAGSACNGNGTCGHDTAFIAQPGRVCVAGAEVAPTQTTKCTFMYDCVADTCAANK